MWSVEDAMREFLATPCQRPPGAAGPGWTNDAVVVYALGVRGVEVKDPASFDAASLAYEISCETFRQAFRVCARPYDNQGHRDWRDFDIETLRACRPEFSVLALPEWLEEMRTHAELEALADRFGAGDGVDEEDENAALVKAWADDEDLPF
jgi:hypothetical protein